MTIEKSTERRIPFNDSLTTNHIEQQLKKSMTAAHIEQALSSGPSDSQQDGDEVPGHSSESDHPSAEGTGTVSEDKK